MHLAYPRSLSLTHVACASAISLLLLGCGGGGGSDSLTAQSGEVVLPSEQAGSGGSASNPSTSNPDQDGNLSVEGPTSNNGSSGSNSGGSNGNSGSSNSNSGSGSGSNSGGSQTQNPSQSQPPAPAELAPYGQNASDYRLTFSEEFESGFNTSVWNDTIWYEQSNATKNYTVENGALKIWPQRDASGNFFNRTIDTDGKYYQTYGFFEIEAKLPIGKGTWPAFWLFNHIGDRRPEIDVMEAYAGGGPNSGWSDANFHPTAYAPTVWLNHDRLAGSKTIQTPDLSAGFHRYAVKWEPNRQTFYFDGKEVYSLNVSMGDPMYIMLDLWYGSASGQPDNTTPTGKNNSYEVRYVRAWQFR